MRAYIRNATYGTHDKSLDRLQVCGGTASRYNADSSSTLKLSRTHSESSGEDLSIDLPRYNLSGTYLELRLKTVPRFVQLVIRAPSNLCAFAQNRRDRTQNFAICHATFNHNFIERFEKFFRLFTFLVARELVHFEIFQKPHRFSSRYILASSCARAIRKTYCSNYASIPSRLAHSCLTMSLSANPRHVSTDVVYQPDRPN